MQEWIATSSGVANQTLVSEKSDLEPADQRLQLTAQLGEAGG